ncbi:MAG: hypothetical protein K1X48_05125 [Burkholderiaceae bacterium]|nr:hypothetical protein [Burkholderiaceae bacterium]
METQSAAQKPQPVVTAVNLLWASLAVGLVKMLMDFSNLSSMAPAAFTNFILIFTFALIAFLIFKISAGRDWARSLSSNMALNLALFGCWTLRDKTAQRQLALC